MYVCLCARICPLTAPQQEVRRYERGEGNFYKGVTSLVVKILSDSKLQHDYTFSTGEAK